MKKGLLILLTVVFGLANFGVNIHYLYCCGNLADVTVSLHAQHEDCGMTEDDGMMMTEDDPCCETKSVSLKVSPDQAPGIHQDHNFPPLPATAVIPEFYYVLADHTNLKAHPQFFNLPPPLTPDRTVLHANFRI